MSHSRGLKKSTPVFCAALSFPTFVYALVKDDVLVVQSFAKNTEIISEKMR